MTLMDTRDEYGEDRWQVIGWINEEFFRKAHINLPPKQSVRLDLDTDVLNWFKSQG